jgi:hypothetical protein
MQRLAVKTHLYNAWMIDGWSLQRYVETITQYCPWQAPNVTTNMYDNYFIHCNIGSSSNVNYNAYYNEGIFKHFAGIVTNIKPQ